MTEASRIQLSILVWDKDYILWLVDKLVKSSRSSFKYKNILSKKPEVDSIFYLVRT